MLSTGPTYIAHGAKSDIVARAAEQAARMQRLFAAVVMAALDDAITENIKYGDGADRIRRWASSRDGKEVLSCAGIEPSDRVARSLSDFVRRGVKTTQALATKHRETGT